VPIGNAAIVILGASGDLAQRKLVPALSSLWELGQLEPPFVVMGSGRSEFSDESFRERFDVAPGFAHFLHNHRGTAGLRHAIASKGDFKSVVFFLALPPIAYASTARELAAEGFGPETSIIIEKPFGSDYESARSLNRELAECFDESRIYRIDHYLAKEAVQNILVFRFANSLFYPVWNSRYIESIQINAFEQEGVGTRGAYYDRAGVVRDMVQNHLTQLLCLITMESPVSLDAEEIRMQKLNVLKALRVAETCRMQYAGYRGERNVNPHSTTETYAELKLYIDNFRWSGMPVYIRCGKAVCRKGTEIGVKFKPLPKLLFNRDGDLPPNRIVFRIQPTEGIVVDLSSKVPGGELRVTNTKLKLCYRDHFGSDMPEAYERLLLDALKRDRTLFVSGQETELSWRVYEPHLDKGHLRFYAPGTTPEPCLFSDWIDFAAYGEACDEQSRRGCGA
jgi:glucose-6-phosphate 1-dehydrogenase